MTTKTEMVTFDQAIQLKGRKAIDFFSKKENLTPLVDFVKTEALATVPNVETKKGRDAIGSTALKISKSRKALTEAIDASISDMQAKVKTAKGVSQYVIEELNQVRSKVLAPRDRWQVEQDLIEENRIKGIKEDIDNILGIGTLQGNESKEEIASLVEAVESIDVSEGYEEFTADAAQAVKDVLKTLNDKVLSIIEVDRQAEQTKLIADEQKRSQITERLNKLAMIPMDLLNKPSSKIKDKIDSLNKYEVPESEFGESYQQAVDSVKTVIGQLTSMFDNQIIIEEQARLIESQNQEPEPNKVANSAVTHGVGIMDGEGKNIPVKDFYQRQNAMAETMSKSAPTLAAIDMASGPDETATIEMVSITKYEYDQLNLDSEMLGHLMGAGVDNWDGWDIALSQMSS